MKHLPLSTKEFKDIQPEDYNEPIVHYMHELVDICIQGVCFEIHRSLRLGYWELETVDDEAQKEFELVDQAGLDVFGEKPVKKQQECACPNCERSLAANRFAPHLEKCMGMGRNSSRIASRRLQNSGRVEEFNVDEDIDFDWGYEFERKGGRKGKREKEKNSPKRAKVKKGESGISNLATNGSGGSRPGTPCSTASGDTSTTTNIKTGPTLQALEALSYEEKVALLTQTCGAISEHTGKMCTRTGRCVQHSDEQRIKVRGLLLGDVPIDDVPWPSMRAEGVPLEQEDLMLVDVDGYDELDGGPLLRDLTPLSWDESMSTGSESSNVVVNVVPSPVVAKPPKKAKGRKTRSR